MLGLGGEERAVVSKDGTRLRVIETGRPDGDVVLLVHGFVSTAEAWSLVVPRLVKAGRRVVLMEQRGHGGSTIGGDGLYLEAIGDDLAAVIESVPDDGRQFTLAGHSMGTISAFALGRRRPDLLPRIERFVGASALHRGRGKPVGLELKRHILRTRPYEWARNIRPLGVVFTRTALGPAAGKSLVEATYDMYRRAPGRMIEELGRQLLTFDYSDSIPDFTVPTALLVGTADTKTPPRLAAELAALLPDAQLVSVPDVGHMTPLEEPDVLADLILAAD